MYSGRLAAEFRDRTKQFASATIQLFVALPRERDEVRVIARQLLRSGTSVAAQVREASRARSDAEFCSKLEGALQEADESQLWLELLREDCAVASPELDALHTEAGELIGIFITMVNRTKARADRK